MEGDQKNPLEDEGVDYDALSEEEYIAQMEKKVDYYKLHYPDMYEKAVQWLKMLEHSEVYKKNSGEESTGDSDNLIQARDILKNALFNGLSVDELNEKEIILLDEHVPGWRSQLE